MIWRRIAILVFIVLPALLMFLGILQRSILDPSSMLDEGSQVRMWLCLILPSSSAVSYGMSIYVKFRGHSWARFPKIIALLLVIPTLVAFYLLVAFFFIVLVFAAITGGSFGSYM